MGRKFIDLSGKIFERLTVLDEYKKSKSGDILWLCECSCENKTRLYVTSSDLQKGRRKSCKCLHKDRITKDLSGQKFGRLLVLRFAYSKNKKKYWWCQCDCKSPEKAIDSGNLKNGSTLSCGCWIREVTSKRSKKYNDYKLDGDYGIGYTLKNEEFWFDLEDYSKIKNCCWFINIDGYVCTSIDGEYITFHNFVTGYKITDHQNGIRHDNRKNNLRKATDMQNAMNRGKRSDNTSGYIGVSWDKRSDKWVAQIQFNKEKIHLGYFANIKDAIIARQNAELKYFKEFGSRISRGIIDVY